MNFQELKWLILMLEDLQKISKTLHKLNEHNCNFGESPRRARKRKELEERAEEIFAVLKKFVEEENIKIEFEGDPRSSAIQIVLGEYEDKIYI